MAKRRKISLNWKPILQLALIVNIGAGLLHSRVSALKRIEVQGLPTAHTEAARAFLQSLMGIPAPKLNRFMIESSLANFDDVEAAVFERSLFGLARVTIQRRKAVAHLDAGKQVFLCEDGTVFSSLEGPTDVPKLDWPQDLRLTFATLAAPVDALRIAALAAKLPKLNVEGDWTIAITESGIVSLRQPGARVVLGTCDDLSEKLAAFERLLLSKPTLFKDNSELNLMAPDRPVVVPRG